MSRWRNFGMLAAVALAGCGLGYSGWSYFGAKGEARPSPTEPFTERVKVVLPPILQGDKDRVEFKFVLKNPTDQPISGLRVTNSSCSCSKAILEATEVRPNSSTSVLLLVDLRSFQGLKKVSCTVSGHQKQTRNWICEGELSVIPRLEVHPPTLAFEHVRFRGSASKILTVKARRYAAEPRSSLRVPKEIGNHVTMSVSQRATLTLNSPQGLFEDIFDLNALVRQPSFNGATTAHLICEQGRTELDLAIPITWSIANDYVFSPSTAFFVISNGHSRQHVDIDMRLRDGRAFNVCRWRTDESGISVSFTKTDSGCHMIVNYQPSEKRLFYSGHIEIETDYDQQPIILFPIAAVTRLQQSLTE